MRQLILLLALALSLTAGAQTPAWTQKADFPGTAREGAVSFSIGNKVYMGIGGTSSDFYEYDTQTNTWTQRANIPISNKEFATCFSIGGYGYVLSTNSWNMSYPRFVRYDPSSDSWAELGINLIGSNGSPLAFRNENQSVSFVINGKAYVGTGHYSGGCYNRALKYFYEYDPVADQWRSLPQFPGEARELATAFVLDGKGYVGAGKYYQPMFYVPNSIHPGQGYTCPELSETYANFYRFDPVSETWEAIESYPGGAQYGLISFVVDNKAYVGGGQGDSFYTYDTATGWNASIDFPGGQKTSGAAAVVGSKAYYGTGKNAEGGLTQDFWEFTYDTSFIGLAGSGLLSQAPFCTDSNFSVGYESYGDFDPQNVYSIELSDASGSFTNPVTIGSQPGTAPSGTIQCTIPEGMAEGQYLARLVSTSPQYSVTLNDSISVNNSLPLPFIGSQHLCFGNTVGNITGFNAPVRWYSTAEGGDPLAATQLFDTGTYYAARFSSDCESVRIPVAVTVDGYIPAPQVSDLYLCPDARFSTASEFIPDLPGYFKTWYASPDDFATLASIIPVEQETTYYFSYRNYEGCESTRIPVTMHWVPGDFTVIPIASLCQGAPLSDAGGLIFPGGSLNSVTWYLHEYGTATANPANPPQYTTYWAEANYGECSSLREPVEIYVVPETPAPIGAEIQNPDVSAPSVANLLAEGTAIQWYASYEEAMAGANPLATTELLVQGTYYYAIQTVNGCRSSSPLTVIYGDTAAVIGFTDDNPRIWPNPATETIHFELLSPAIGISLYNMMGQQVYNEKLENVRVGLISTATLAAGTYVLKIYSKNSIIQSKIIKQ
jgi:N-acetylneuraminic acid mutarotase